MDLDQVATALGERLGNGLADIRVPLMYGGNAAYTVDASIETVVKLAQQRYKNIMGNDASNAMNAKKTALKEGEAFNLEHALHEWRIAKAKQVADGTIGMRAGGPRKDPVEAKFDDLIMKFVKAQLKSANIKFPKTAEELVTLPMLNEDGSNQRRTIAQMIARAKQTQGERLHPEAVEMVLAEQRALAQPKSDGEHTPESLGI